MSNLIEALLVGLAEELDEAGAGTWDDTDSVAEGDTAVTLMRLPETPTKVICLRPYGPIDDPALTEQTIFIQARCRGGQSPLDVLAISEAVYAALHGLTGVFVNAAEPVHIVQMYRVSDADIGPDSLGRYERSDNYAVQLNSDNPRLA